jgi:hypothetical protein
MKKTYINPQIKVVVLRMNQHVLVGSPNGAYDELGDGAILSPRNDLNLDFDEEF